jgi:hypothetical protein
MHCRSVTVASKRMGGIFELDTIRVHFYCWVGAPLLRCSVAPLLRTTECKSLHPTNLFQSQLSGQVAADLTITSTIMYGLVQSRTGWTNTDQLIRRLVV